MNFELDIPGQLVVFIHIPKTGGSAIRKPLGVFKTRHRFDDRVLLEEKYRDAFKFCFVRKVLDRVVSAFCDFSQNRGYMGTFDNFLSIVTNESIPYELGYGGVQGSIRHHTLPMTHPYNCLDFADHVGRLEWMQEDFDLICDFLNLRPKDLPHVRKSEHGDSWGYFNRQRLRIVERYYEKDFEYLERMDK